MGHRSSVNVKLLTHLLQKHIAVLKRVLPVCMRLPGFGAEINASPVLQSFDSAAGNSILLSDENERVTLLLQSPRALSNHVTRATFILGATVLYYNQSSKSIGNVLHVADYSDSGATSLWVTLSELLASSSL